LLAAAFMSASMQSRTVEKTQATFTPRQIFFDDGGRAGIPALLVHSAAGSTAHFVELLAHLRKSRRAVAIDLRGHGRSMAPPDDDYSIAALASDVEEVRDFLHLERVVLIGHSMGAAVATAYAGVHPGRLAGLLLLDAAHDLRGMPDAEKRGLIEAVRGERWIQAVKQFWEPLLAPSTEDVRQRLWDGLAEARHEAVAESLISQLEFDPKPGLESFRGPKLSITTQVNDGPGAFHDLVADLPHHRIEGTGHWPHLDAPDRVHALIDDFLARIADGARSLPE
jgi:pimeloyl-ACP methyl ester carboxylesterase